MFADLVVPFWDWMLSHTLEIGIGRTVDPFGIGKIIGEMILGDGQEFFLVKVLSLLVVRH